MTGIRRIFGLRTYRPGAASISASGENEKAKVLQQVANIVGIAPLFTRQNGSSIEIGFAGQGAADAVAYPCRVVAALLNGTAMTSGQMGQPQDPARVTYTVRPDDRATGAVPPGVDLTAPLRVRYGRPFGDTVVKVLASTPNDLCFVSSIEGVPELWIIGERIATRICEPPAPAAPTPPAAPPPVGLSANLSVASSDAFGTPSTTTADPQMATHAKSEPVTLDAGVTDGITPSFYVGDSDYATLTGLIQDGSIKVGWGRNLIVQWSPDNRVWQRAYMLDPSGGTKAQAVLSADDFISFDVREGVAYLRAKWDPATGALGSSAPVELKWTKKRGTSR